MLNYAEHLFPARNVLTYMTTLLKLD